MKNGDITEDQIGTILPVDEAIERPLWSVLIPTYNCGGYLEETLKSVLLQDPGPEKMEIIVVDDHSTMDNPGKVVKQIAGNRVRFIRQQQNVGKARNYESGLSASRGYLIHQLHGDDRARPGFYGKMESIFANYSQAGAAFCRSLYIDSHGRWVGLTGIEQKEEGLIPDFLDRIYTGQRIQTPAMVVKREVYEKLGCFHRALPCFEDWEMWMRIAKNYSIAYTTDVLSEYRGYPENTSRKTLLDGTRLKTHKKLMTYMDKQFFDLSVDSKKRRERNQVQADYWAEQLRISRKDLELSKKISVYLYVLKMSPSVRTFRRLVVATLS